MINRVFSFDFIAALTAISKSPIVREGGFWSIPDAPGLGIEVNEKEADKYPYKEEIYTPTDAYLDDGTVVDW